MNVSTSFEVFISACFAPTFLYAAVLGSLKYGWYYHISGFAKCMVLYQCFMALRIPYFPHNLFVLSNYTFEMTTQWFKTTYYYICESKGREGS